MTNTVVCPKCEQRVDHDRGYLVEHQVAIVRGELITGAQLCDFSNYKPHWILKTVKLTGKCPVCFIPHADEFTETYPGSHNGAARFLHVECDECGPTQLVLLTDNHVIAESE